MKMKSVLLAFALFILALSIPAQTIEGVATNTSKFTAALVVMTNKTVVVNSSSNLFVNGIGKAKVTNKQLMSLFANWMSITNWPVGAHLAFDWNSYQVVVVDASGTNVLMYCLDDFKTGTGDITTNITIHTFTHGKKAGTSVTNITYVTNFVDGRFLQVDWFHAPGATAESALTTSPGSDKFVAWNGAYFRIHDNVGNTDVTCLGGDLQAFSQTWDANTNGVAWKDIEVGKFNYYGGQKVLGTIDCTVGGVMSASGTGKGFNPKMN